MLDGRYQRRRSRNAVPMAKAYASDMAKNVTSEAIQVHGGIGFTWEHDMHLYHRRALAGEQTSATPGTSRDSGKIPTRLIATN